MEYRVERGLTLVRIFCLAYILTHTSNAKCFRNVTLVNIQGLAEKNCTVQELWPTFT